MKKLLTLFALSALFFVPVPVRANTVTVPDPDLGISITETTYLPTAINSSSGVQSTGYFSVCQQLYFASELAKASSNTITAITFYYNSGANLTRKLRVWMNDTDINEVPSSSNTPNMLAPGTKVFSGDVSLVAGSPFTITFDTPYTWDGESNIIVTVFDSTGVKNTGTAGKIQMFATSGVKRFLNKTYTAPGSFIYAGWTMDNLTAATANSFSAANRAYVNKITFTFAGAAVPPATPSMAVSATTTSSATLLWSAVLNAASYDLQQSANGVDWSTLSSGETGTSFEWTSLSAASTQYARIRANNAVGSSDWSDAVTVTTDPVFVYDDITFDKWSEPASLPSSGDYYLNGDVAFGWESSDITLTDDLNLCLNGHIVDIFYLKFIVPSGKTLTIYDNVGGGKITGVVASEVGVFEDYVKSLIVVKSGGTLILKEGVIENNYDPDEDGSSYAIYSNGTLRIAGSPVIKSKAVDIYLSASGVITLDGAISNAEKYTVDKYAGSIVTTGWNTHMGSKRPSNYFKHADDSKGFYLNEGEVNVIDALSLSESSSNTSIASNEGQLVNVALTRSFSSASFNTICLPFALPASRMEEVFGTGYDLEEFKGASYDAVQNEISLDFDQVSALEAGKPYLIQPAADVVNPAFEAVTISATSPVDVTTDYIDFKGVFAPVELEGGNKDILFVGPENTLFFPSETGFMNGFRAYFEVHGDAKNAVHARIVQRHNTQTGVEKVQDNVPCTKVLRDGQLYLMYNGQMYNVHGQLVK